MSFTLNIRTRKFYVRAVVNKEEVNGNKPRECTRKYRMCLYSAIEKLALQLCLNATK